MRERLENSRLYVPRARRSRNFVDYSGRHVSSVPPESNSPSIRALPLSRPWFTASWQDEPWSMPTASLAITCGDTNGQVAINGLRRTLR
jgi:hypothetical protein